MLGFCTNWAIYFENISTKLSWFPDPAQTDPKAGSISLPLLLSLCSNNHVLDTLPKTPGASPRHSQMQPYIVKTWGKGQPHCQKRWLWNNWFARAISDEQDAHARWDLMALYSPLYLIRCCCAGEGHSAWWGSHTVCLPSQQGVWGVPLAAGEDSHTRRAELSAPGVWGWQFLMCFFRRLSRRSWGGCWISQFHSTANSFWEEREWFTLALLDPPGLDINSSLMWCSSTICCWM